MYVCLLETLDALADWVLGQREQYRTIDRVFGLVVRGRGDNADRSLDLLARVGI